MELQQFIKTSPVARTARVPARVVVRRFHSTAGAVRDAVARGTVEVASEPVCDLVAGGVVLGSGTIREQDGELVFVMQEVKK